MAMEKTVGRNDYLDFMKAFKYPLAGEFSFRRNLMSDMSCLLYTSPSPRD